MTMTIHINSFSMVKSTFYSVEEEKHLSYEEDLSVSGRLVTES